MAKLIDVEEAVSELKKLIEMRENHSPRLWPGGRSVTALRFAVGWLEKRPVVDAVPVVHSKWITEINHFDGLNASYIRVCPECKYRYKNSYAKGHNFCPNCGAMMDLED